MDKTITDASVRAYLAIGNYERSGRPEDKARMEAAMKGAQDVCEPLTDPQKPRLRLIPNCGARGTRDDARHMTDYEARMYYHGRNIRAIREGKMSIAERPSAKLSAVPNCGSLLGGGMEPPTDPAAA